MIRYKTIGFYHLFDYKQSIRIASIIPRKLKIQSMSTKTLSTILLISTILLLSCNPAVKKTTKDNANLKPQTDPAWVVNQIFIAAKEGKYELLSELCDPEGKGDGDTKFLCTIQNASTKDKQEFDEYFKTGKIIGEPVIEGEEAKVEFTFGPDGNKKETMNLVRRGDRWYLESF